MLDIMTMDFIRTARSKGVSEQKVIYKHALKNTFIPFVTIAGMQMGSLLAGAIVTEKVFAWPGMGRLFLEAIGVMDFPVIIAWALVTATHILNRESGRRHHLCLAGPAHSARKMSAETAPRTN